jgi:hypothetical protein
LIPFGNWNKKRLVSEYCSEGKNIKAQIENGLTLKPNKTTVDEPNVLAAREGEKGNAGCRMMDLHDWSWRSIEISEGM